MVRSDAGYARQKVWERDRGICILCRRDTNELARRLGALQKRLKGRHSNYVYLPGPKGQRAVLNARGYDKRRSRVARWIGVPTSRWRSPWDMDHIVPVAEGGGSCGLDNLRTLCIPCHQQQTRRLRRRLSRRRTGQLCLFEEDG